ncbi:MAG TPA: DUF2950 domain-containing protein [Rhizomicrobium sp.]|jgi:hypothetical protein|nr:DUF2950 domain-containing protein [Rhizomicrobium sp.]
MRAFGPALVVLTSCWCLAAQGQAANGPEGFTSPKQAVDALVAAESGDDPAHLLAIFGPAGRDLVSSGDRIADGEARARFVAHYREHSEIVQDSPDRATLLVGTEQWPYPIPVVRTDNVWHFDAATGAQEILNRRIGRNELSAMDVCRDYVRAQGDYAAGRATAKLPPEFAQKFVSSLGQHDGLYWPAAPGENESPIGPQMAAARAEGYAGGTGQRGSAHEPYHGYYYRILTRQGQAAPGGGRDYIVNGRMTRGFALIAFPATYGNSGVMTFMVNQNGIVFQKNLGPDTATVATGMTEFNPDRTWKMR